MEILRRKPKRIKLNNKKKEIKERKKKVKKKKNKRVNDIRIKII